jgi:CubicO group peptidase (beta-lactamase class C family)
MAFVSLLPAALLALAQDPGARFGPSEVWELLDGLVPAQMKRDRVPGAAVAVVMDGEIVFLEGYGSARLEPETPVSAETTLFRIGSVSKVFTPAQSSDAGSRSTTRSRRTSAASRSARSASRCRRSASGT